MTTNTKKYNIVLTSGDVADEGLTLAEAIETFQYYISDDTASEGDIIADGDGNTVYTMHHSALTDEYYIYREPDHHFSYAFVQGGGYNYLVVTTEGKHCIVLASKFHLLDWAADAERLAEDKLSNYANLRGSLVLLDDALVELLALTSDATLTDEEWADIQHGRKIDNDLLVEIVW